MDQSDSEIVVVGAMGFIGRAVVLEAARMGRGVIGVVRRAKEREGALRAFVAERGGDPNLVRLIEGDVTR
ncbi:MAG: NAD-dependent epimerase/dehydratase family protein, partial [Polyangiaceae bacterium]|nr:NAD-dependent epimerase/dehydratase family protein [Polyangiaceae bacterium]